MLRIARKVKVLWIARSSRVQVAELGICRVRVQAEGASNCEKGEGASNCESLRVQVTKLSYMPSSSLS